MAMITWRRDDRMVDKVQTARDIEDSQAIVRSLDQLADVAKAIAEDVEKLTLNPEQEAISDVANIATTISPTYEQSEVDALAADIKTVSDKVDLILSALRSANILGE